MSRRPLYPEGGIEMNVYVPVTVRDGLRTVAGHQRPRQSVSQLVTMIVEDWLRRRGELPMPEREEAAV